MLTIYGRLMPLRILEEVRFWKMQEKEHTVVIRELVPNLEPEYRKLLEEWEDIFARTENAAQNWIETVLRQDKKATSEQLREIDRLVKASINQSREFIRHLYLLMERSRAIGSSPVYKVVMMHIIRESEYFLGVLDALMRSGPSPLREAAQEQDDADQNGGNDYRESSENEVPRQSENPGVIPDQPVPIGGHKLPPLPYPYDALEPYIDEQTMRLHHDKHHLSYVKGLNEAESMMKTARETSDFELIKHWEREAAFNGAGHYLHTIFWNVMSPKGGGKATGPIAAQIDRDFGNFERFKKHFSKAAENVEGGGWAILVWSPRSHRLEILQAEKHQNLSQWDVIPLLVLDVWEHAYYLKYQNERKKYIDAWWNTVNWDHVNERFAHARRLKWMPY